MEVFVITREKNRLIIALSFAVVALFIVQILMGYSPVLMSYGNDFCDSLLVYFLIARYYIRFRAKDAPWWVCFIPAITIGPFLEVVQYNKIRIGPFPVGTFDLLDIPVFIFGAYIAYEIDRRCIRRQS